MSIEAQNYLNAFRAMPEGDQRELASLILRQTQDWDSPELDDKQLAELADATFLELDRREEADGT